MPELASAHDENTARTRAADRMAMWALVAVERLAVDLGKPSPIDGIVEQIHSVDPTATPAVGRDLQVKERAEELLMDNLLFLQKLRDQSGGRL